MDVSVLLATVTAFGAVLYWFLKSPVLADHANRILQSEKHFISQTWIEVTRFFDWFFGERLISVRALTSSIKVSALMMVLFVFFCAILSNLPTTRILFQFWLAALILNGVGDLVSVIQTRLIIKLHRWGEIKSVFVAVLLDAILSGLVFVIFYLIALRANMYVSGTSLTLRDALLHNYLLLSDPSGLDRRLFLILSLASCMSSTIIHFIASLAVIYVKIARAVGFDVSKDVTFHLRSGAVFSLAVLMILGFLVSSVA
jgi:hypothetical protein